MLYQLSYLGTARRRPRERAVYSQAKRACPPCFASGYARRSLASSPRQIAGKSCLFGVSRLLAAWDGAGTRSAELRPAPSAASAVPRSVVDPDLRVPDHRAPFVGFRFEEGGERGLGRAFRVGAEFLEPRLDRGIDQRRIGVGVDPGDDVLRRPRGPEEPEPRENAEAGHRLGDG